MVNSAVRYCGFKFITRLMEKMWFWWRLFQLCSYYLK